MGVTERPLEHLAPSDMAIARVRRLLVRAARAHAKGGTLPPSATDHKIYGQALGRPDDGADRRRLAGFLRRAKSRVAAIGV